jgi:hypothetical protein
MTAHYAKVDIAMLEEIAQPWPGVVLPPRLRRPVLDAEHVMASLRAAVVNVATAANAKRQLSEPQDRRARGDRQRTTPTPAARPLAQQ